MLRSCGQCGELRRQGREITDCLKDKKLKFWSKLTQTKTRNLLKQQRKANREPWRTLARDADDRDSAVSVAGAFLSLV